MTHKPTHATTTDRRRAALPIRTNVRAGGYAEAQDALDRIRNRRQW